MESLKKISVVFFCMLLFNCSSQEEVEKTQVNSELPDVIGILEKMEEQKNLSSKISIGFYFTTVSDFVSASNGCYTLNTRVYMINSVTTEKILLASENVNVGGCLQEKTQTSKSNKTECDSFVLENGDRFFSDGVEMHFCMEELMKYSTIYDSYVNSVNNLLKLKR